MIENPRYNRAGGHNVATSGILYFKCKNIYYGNIYYFFLFCILSIVLIIKLSIPHIFNLILSHCLHQGFLGDVGLTFGSVPL